MAIRRFYDPSSIFSTTRVTAAQAGISDAVITGAGAYSAPVVGTGAEVARVGSNIITSATPGATGYGAGGQVIRSTPAAAGSSARARASRSEILEAISGGLESVSTLTEGLNARDAAAVEADFLELQAKQEEISRFREQRDLAKERDRFLARSRAALAAQGADTASGSSLAILSSQRTEYAEKNRRLLADSVLRAGTLRAKSKNTRMAGGRAFNAAAFKAGQQLFSSAASIL